jgi:hypothetical protein
MPNIKASLKKVKVLAWVLVKGELYKTCTSMKK